MPGIRSIRTCGLEINRAMGDITYIPMARGFLYLVVRLAQPLRAGLAAVQHPLLCCGSGRVGHTLSCHRSSTPTRAASSGCQHAWPRRSSEHGRQGPVPTQRLWPASVRGGVPEGIPLRPERGLGLIWPSTTKRASYRSPGRCSMLSPKVFTGTST